MIVIGITGTIGSGKTAVTSILREFGYKTFDADACVHKLYQGKAVQAVGQEFPNAIINGKVDRDALSKELAQNPESFKILESIIHPLVKKEKQNYLRAQALAGETVVFFDIPLLFETGQENHFDVIIVVSVDEQKRVARVLQRSGMTQEKLDLILSQQMSDTEKRSKADYVIYNNDSVDELKQSVKKIMSDIERSLEDGSIITDQALKKWDL